MFILYIPVPTHTRIHPHYLSVNAVYCAYLLLVGIWWVLEHNLKIIQGWDGNRVKPVETGTNTSMCSRVGL